jgi:sensor domain CHASE-containing protein
MSLKLKGVFIFLSIFVVYIAADYTVQQFVVLPSFIALERKEAQKDLQRAVEAIKREIHHLAKLCWDWSAWDDTYEFIISRSEKYIESNLPLTTFIDNTIHLIYFVTADGKVVWGESHDLKTEKPIHLSDFQKSRFSENHPLITKPDPSRELSQTCLSGIINTEKGPLLIAARPILTSENKGPSRGTLIMGRLLDEDLVKTLSDQSKVMFSIQPLGSNRGTEPKGEAPSHVTPEGSYLFEKEGDSRLLIRTTLPDVEGKAALRITASFPRTISAKGYDTTRYALLTGIVSMLLVLVIMLLVLQQTILRPIVKLKNHALSIEKTGDLSARISMKRRDEIGALGRGFDRMMEKLEQGANSLKDVNDRLEKDIVRRIQAEKALRESEASLARAKKMESLGLMAGGIAHDLNNILSGIVTYPELLLM